MPDDRVSSESGLKGVSMAGNTILEVKNISKRFGAVRALTDVSMALREGEILCIVGENGAGKSTLMNVITGIHIPEEGEIFVRDEKVVLSGPIDAIERGIGIVHQEMVNCPDITVAENIFMSSIVSSKKAFVNYKEMNQRAAKLLENFGENISPRTKMGALKMSEQQIAEIVKALSTDARILIFDEPTSSLTEDEVRKLFAVINTLRSQGIAVMYITHRMNEVFELSDRIMVLRDGFHIGTYETADVDRDFIVNKMIGRQLVDYCPPKSNRTGEAIFEAYDFSDDRYFHEISFSLNKYEILGFSGLIGAGRSELMQAIVGLGKSKSGVIAMDGKPHQFKAYRQALDQGIVYLTEDRKREGLFLRMDVMKNLSLMNLRTISGRFFVKRSAELTEAEKYREEMDVKCSGLDQLVGTLSGGNQQKILIAKALSIKPRLIIFDEPTRGIDVGSKAEIYKTMRNLANEGIGIIVVSSDLPEIVSLCDRVCVMYEGRMSGEVSGGDVNEQRIIKLASGI